MKKGSITVFLSLVLVLLFSFLLTALEAARIRGATAYVTMLTELAGDSFLASYYYPLFQNYRLFGVDMGDEEGFFEESAMAEGLEKNFTYGTEGLEGGLLSFSGGEVVLENYETLLSDGEAEFLSQVRQQTALDGLSLALEELFSEAQFTEAGVVGEVYREQEEALTATAMVTEELLNLMELVDGICMKDGGIAFDATGKMQTNEFFIKQLVPMEQGEIKAMYDAEEVFRISSAGYFRADRAAARIEALISEANQMESYISWSDSRIWEYQYQLAELTAEWEAERKRQEKEKKPDKTNLRAIEARMDEVEAVLTAEQYNRDSYEIRREATLSEAKTQYKELKKTLENVEALLKQSLDIVDKIEKKQKLAQVSVQAYEAFLEGMKSSLSEELYQAFLQELETMKIYAGLEEQGFSVDTMRRSLTTDYELLQELSLAGFSESRLGAVNAEMVAVKRRMAEYTVEGLWFSYGDIVVAEQTWENVTGFLGELLTTGILSLVGISKEEQSDRSLNGEALPSAGLEQESIVTELMECIDQVQELFQQGGMGEVLKVAGNSFLDGTALELYSMRYFHCYGETSPYTRLNYEREYIVFGGEEDKSNLLSMVLQLVAIRALFSMVMILKQPDRVARLEALSAGVAGFTGIPVLAAVVKYSLLLLWSVEEALVEVSALLQGKRVAVVSTGTVSFGELFLMNKAAIERKAKLLPEGVGAAYQDYLTLISLTRGTKEKAYRIMDLIQENIRLRYNDSFRIRNVVTAVSFRAKTELVKLFDAGVVPAAAYTMECREEKAY